MDLGVGARDPLAESSRSTVEAEERVAGGQHRPAPVAGIEDGLNSNQFHEVVATSDDRESPRQRSPTPARTVAPWVQQSVEAREPNSQLRRLGVPEADG
jgi:hypothetical protein